MRIFLLLLVCVIGFLISCSTSTESVESLEFEKMSIEYRKSGGWISTFVLSIDGIGVVRVFELSHASLDTIDEGNSNLSTSEKRKLGKLFEPFNDYKSYYQPAQYYTDGNIHQTILTYEGTSDTVAVYEPQNSNIPENLKEIIVILDQKIQTVLNK